MQSFVSSPVFRRGRERKKKQGERERMFNSNIPDSEEPVKRKKNFFLEKIRIEEDEEKKEKSSWRKKRKQS